MTGRRVQIGAAVEISDFEGREAMRQRGFICECDQTGNIISPTPGVKAAQPIAVAAKPAETPVADEAQAESLLGAPTVVREQIDMATVAAPKRRGRRKKEVVV